MNKKSSDTGKRKRDRSKTPRTKKPAGMSLEEWQIALRREFATVQQFTMKNMGDNPIFSDFIVENPETGGKYKVAIRGSVPGSNYCSCPDFAVNTLGTCKHVEFVLSKLKRKRGAKKAFKEGYKEPYSSVSLRYGIDRKVVFTEGTECPAELISIRNDYFDESGFLKPEGFLRFDEFLRRASKVEHELRCYEDAVQHIAHIRDQEKLRETVDKAFGKNGNDSDFKDLLKVPLYPYQKTGAIFAARSGRSIIADEMGLGKTLEAIAACEILARVAGIQRVLVVCPASLKYQWKAEIEKFTGRSALVIEGLLPSRRLLYETESFYKIVNYDIVFRDEEFIQGWFPDIIILDEAQRIKNWKTRTAQSVKKLDSPFAIVLTGTPLENRLEELHSIVEFVDRFHLGPRFRFLHEHQVTDDAGMVVGYKELGKINQTLSNILIRRTKKEVLNELPERLEKNFFVDMTKEQMNYHEENREIVARIVAKWRRNHFLSETDQRRLMMALQKMRMSCNSTYLLDKETDYGHKCDELLALLYEIFEDSEAKAVVFSQWLGTHELIVRRLGNNGWDYAYLHGGVPSFKRKDLIKRFRKEPDCRLFLSTEAGSVGMNLQNASVVINMDLPWNPAVLEQRIGRVHRLGQHRPVRVVNFIASGAIEHGMLSLLSFKKSLFAGVLDGKHNEVFLGGSRLKRFMESVETATVSIPSVAVTDTEPEIETADETEKIHVRKIPERRDASPEKRHPWEELASAGLAFLEKLGEALTEGEHAAASSGIKKSGIESIIEKDGTGRTYIRMPAPSSETIRKVADILYKLSGQ